MTSWSLMKAFPWASVDSSSWGQGFRFGTVAVFDPDLGKFCKVDLRDAKQAYRHEKLIRRYGFSPNDLCVHGRYDRAKICALSALSYMEAEVWLNRYWGSARPFRLCDGELAGPACGVEGLGQGVPGGEHGGGRKGLGSLRLPSAADPFVAGREVTSRPAGLELSEGLRCSVNSSAERESRIFLSDTSNGINFGRAASVLSRHRPRGKQSQHSTSE